MKIKLISDLHVDHHADNGVSLIKSIPADDHDILVIAGDLCEVHNLDLFEDTWEMLSLKFKKILFVTGNHEYWKESPWVADETIDEVLEEFGNVARIKTGESHLIDGYRFIGGTMWFKDTGNAYAQKNFSDFKQIQNFRSYVFKENEKFIEMFTNGKAQRNDIVITHHLPSSVLVDKIYQGLPENQFFVCEMMDYIKKIKPLAWLYGHTHRQSNRMIEGTWFVTNPFGYPREVTNMGFDENLVLQIII